MCGVEQWLLSVHYCDIQYEKKCFYVTFIVDEASKRDEVVPHRRFVMREM